MTLRDRSDTDVLTGLLRPGASLPPALRPAIEGAARKVLRTSGEGPSGGAAHDVCRILEVLRREREVEAAIAFMKAARSIRGVGDRAVMLQIDLLEAAGRARALDAVLAASRFRPGTPYVHRFVTLCRRRGVRLGREAIEAALGPLSGDLRDILGRIPVEPALAAVAAEGATALHRFTETGLDLDVWTRRYAWGRAARDAIALVGIADRDDPLLAPLVRSLGGVVTPCDWTPVTSAVAAGRSVLVASMHAGVGGTATGDVPGHVPQIKVGRGAATRLDGNRKTLGVGGALAADFMRVVKTVRNEPHVIGILPDGPDGREQRVLPLLGGEVSIGAGAAALAWHARALTVFFATRWSDGRLEAYLTAGPVADPAGDREAFEAAFNRFYVDCTRQVIVGPPEDIVRYSVYMRQLTEPGGAGAAADDEGVAG